MHESMRHHRVVYATLDLISSQINSDARMKKFIRFPSRFGASAWGGEDEGRVAYTDL
jgi:hypothetical protein